MSDCIRIEKLDEQLYCLKEVESVNLYLILGKEKALLFDTGYGYVDYRSRIREITELPLIVVNSHGDPDHALGSYLFPEVYMHRGDYNFLMDLDQDARRKMETIEYRLKKLPELADEMDMEAYVKPNLMDTVFYFINDGDTFGLGGLTCRVCFTPGHSKGSICLFCPEKGWLFTGDTAAYYNVFYQTGLSHHAPFRTYLDSLKRILQFRDEIREVYPAHGRKPIPVTVLDEMIGCVRDIVVNYKKDEAIQTMVGTAYAHTYGHALILYCDEILNEALENGIE